MVTFVNASHYGLSGGDFLRLLLFTSTSSVVFRHLLALRGRNLLRGLRNLV